MATVETAVRPTDASDLAEFPEYPLWGRYARVFKWTPFGLESLLDAGCAWGYGTRFFTAKAKHVYGLDPNAASVRVARDRYRDIAFVEGDLERTPFQGESFDAIVCCDTLEHVTNERECLSELWRILRPGGVATITVPHGGPLAFLDPDNYGRALLVAVKRRLPSLHRWYRRAIVGAPAAVGPEPPRTGDTHRHYTLGDLLALLEQSKFRGGYEIRRVRRSGFVLEAIVTNVHFLLSRVVRGRTRAIMDRLAGAPLALDYRIPYGRLANNLAVQVVKRP